MVKKGVKRVVLLNRNQRRDHIRRLQTIILNKALPVDEKTFLVERAEGYEDANYNEQTRIASLLELEDLGTSDDFVDTCNAQLNIHPQENEINQEVVKALGRAYKRGSESGDE